MTPIRPWQIWWADLDPAEGREQSGRRPVLVVSSRFHLALTQNTIITVLPITNRERPTWSHRPFVNAGPVTGWVITEQIRTIATTRLIGRRPAGVLDPHESDAINRILKKMIT